MTTATATAPASAEGGAPAGTLARLMELRVAQDADRAALAPATYAIPLDALEEATKRIATINRKAERAGVAGVTMRRTGTERRERREPFMDGTIEKTIGTGEFFQVAIVEVVAPVVRIGGWRPVAQIQHEDAGAIFRFFGTVTDEERAAVRAGAEAVAKGCDHCHTNRERLNTYALIGGDGQIAIVGSSCVRDFTGGHDAHAILSLMEEIGSLLEGELADYSGRADRRAYYLNTAEYLEHVAAMIRTEGWTPRSQADGWQTTATADRAAANLRDTKRGIKGAIKPELIDADTAAAALAWARDLPFAARERSDYLNNLYVACADEWTNPRNTGIVASAVAAYQREMGRQAEARRVAVTSPSAFQGAIGERLRGLALVVEFIRDFDGDFGPSRLHRMADAAGNVYVWTTSAEAFQIGDRVTLTGTVKEHKARGGVAETILTRAKVERPKTIQCADEGAGDCPHPATLKRGAYWCGGGCGFEPINCRCK